MLNTLKALAAPAVMQRITLLLNHVLASELAATHRLKSHAGRRIALRLDGWPALPRADAELPGGRHADGRAHGK